jgi:UDP-N-acetylmuramoylalanine--D-glutamate ligase
MEGTTTMLTYHLNQRLNIGLETLEKFCKVADDTRFYMLELSSFQLDGIVDYKPHRYNLI